MKFQTMICVALFAAALPFVSSATAQEIDSDKLEAARRAAYDKFIPDELRDGKPAEAIDVSNAVTGQAAYIYGNSGARPKSTITGPTWNRVYTNYRYPYGNYNYNYNLRFSRPLHSPLVYHYGRHNPYHRTGYFVVGENYTLPSVFQVPYDSRYRRSQPKLFKVRTYVPRHYVYKNGRYHFVQSHTKTQYVPLITRFIRTRYNHGHHSVTIDYSN